MEVTGFKDRRYPSVGLITVIIALLTLLVGFIGQALWLGMWIGKVGEKQLNQDQRIERLEHSHDSR